MSIHIIIALIVAIIFATVQVSLLRSLVRRTRTLIDQLNDLRAHGTSSKAVAEVVWFEPFVRSLTNTMLISDVRDVALRQAEDDVHNAPQYELLQKLSVTAPLIGVILTSTGFAMLGGSLDDIRTLALPLASGVFVGALLAIINQLMLFYAEASLQKSTATARNLIDQYWVQNAARLGDPYRQLNVTTEHFDASVNRLATLIEDLPRSAGPLTSKFTAIANIADTTFREISGFSAGLQAATKSWANAAQHISTVVDKDFILAIESLKSGSRTMNSATQDASQLLKQLHDLVLSLKATVSDQRASFQQLGQLVESNSKWTKDSITDLKTELSQNINGISAPLKTTAADLSKLVPHLANSGEILTAVTKATAGFSNVVEKQFTPANQFVSELSRASVGLSASVEKLNKLLAGLEQVKAEHAATQSALSAVIMNRALPTVEVLQRATGAFEDSAHRIAECSHELANAISMLNRATPNSAPQNRLVPSADMDRQGVIRPKS